MIITTRGKNALKFMIYLTLNQGQSYVKLKEVAEREQISEKYLEQIVAYLQKSQKVKSARGAMGGYRLAKSADMYTVGEIIKCLDGDLYSTDCARDESSCDKREECFCYPLWEKIDQAINNVLDNTSLQDLINWHKVS